MIENKNVMVSICDLNLIKKKSPSFLNIYHADLGACSHDCHGSDYIIIYRDIYVSDDHG